MTDDYRIPPNDIEIEENVLGAMMSSTRAASEAFLILRAEDFYKDAHRLIFSAISALHVAGHPTDVGAVAAHLESRRQLEAAGDRHYLVNLAGSCPNPGSARYYASQVRDLALRRTLGEAAYKIGGFAFDRSSDLEEQLGRAEQEIFDVGERLRRGSTVHLSEPLRESFERMLAARKSGSRVTGLATGFDELDALTGGLQPSNLIIVGGRTSMGKTSLALNIAHHATVECGKPTLVFSLEMSRQEVAERLLLMEGRLDGSRVKGGTISEHELERAKAAARRIADAPLVIDDEGDRTLTEIRSIARRSVARDGTALIIVDYIQLLYGAGRQENRAQEVGKLARDLKIMARELDVPVIAISQLRRPQAGVARKEPHLEDLKESGGIEQNADLVLLIYRPEVDDPRNLELAAFADITLAKHRNGRTGKFRLTWVGAYMSFCNLEARELAAK